MAETGKPGTVRALLRRCRTALRRLIADGHWDAVVVVLAGCVPPSPHWNPVPPARALTAAEQRAWEDLVARLSPPDEDLSPVAFGG